MLGGRPRDDFASVNDLMMLTLCPGRERTDGELRDLFARADLEVESRWTLPTGFLAYELRAQRRGDGA